MNARRWILVSLAGLAVLSLGVFVSTAHASLATSVWQTGTINQSHDTDCEVLLDSNFNHLSSSASVVVGDYFVGAIGYGYVNWGAGNVSYGTTTATSQGAPVGPWNTVAPGNLNALFVLQVAGINTAGQGTGFGMYSFVAPSVANWQNALASSYLFSGSVPAAALKNAAGTVAILYSNPNQTVQQIPANVAPNFSIPRRVRS